MHITILPNRQKPWAIKLAQIVRAFARKHGFRLVAKNADATVCIGGDGTIYYQNFQRRLEGKIIGIGSETSFVCQATRKNWKQRLPVLLENNGTRRSTLELRYKGRRFTALSDAVLHTHDYRVIKVFVKIGNRTRVFEGDGIIVATATGSSGYAYSAGGPRIPVHDRKLLLVPICPYQRAFKPVLLPFPHAGIKIWSDRTSDLVIDGILVGRLKQGERMYAGHGKIQVFA